MIRIRPGRRSIAGLALGALTVSAFALIPIAMSTQSAQAAAGPADYTCNLTIAAFGGAAGGNHAVTLDIDTDAPETAQTGAELTPAVTGTMRFPQSWSDAFIASPVNKMKVAVAGETLAGDALGSVALASAQWNRGGTTGSAMPEVVFDLTGTWPAFTPDEAGDLDLELGDLVGTISLGTSFGPPTSFTAYPMTCTPDDGDVVVDTIAVEQGPADYTCNLTIAAFGGAAGGNHAVTLDIDTDAPETAQTGAELTPAVTGTMRFPQSWLDAFIASPVNKMKVAVAGETLAGDAVGSVALASAQWNRGGTTGSAMPEVVFDLTGTWPAFTPDEAGDLDLELGDLVGTISLGTSFGPPTSFTAYPMTCTPDDGDVVVDTIAVEQGPGGLHVQPDDRCFRWCCGWKSRGDVGHRH